MRRRPDLYRQDAMQGRGCRGGFGPKKCGSLFRVVIYQSLFPSRYYVDIRCILGLHAYDMITRVHVVILAGYAGR